MPVSNATLSFVPVETVSAALIALLWPPRSETAATNLASKDGTLTATLHIARDSNQVWANASWMLPHSRTWLAGPRPRIASVTAMDFASRNDIFCKLSLYQNKISTPPLTYQ